MTIANQQNLRKSAVLDNSKSFLTWALLLEVSFLVVGFPLVTIIVAAASLLAITLSSVMPSSVLLVASGLVATNIIVVFAAAGMLTAKGVHPHEVSWLDWLNKDDARLNDPIFASCPLTCDLQR
jgi:hypothetical protein